MKERVVVREMKKIMKIRSVSDRLKFPIEDLRANLLKAPCGSFGV